MKRKNRICQNLSKFENEIVRLPTMLLAEWVSISPSPPLFVNIIDMKSLLYYISTK